MNAGLHRFAVFTSFCTFLLIVAGGMVTSTGSGLAVPDWPLSYGQVMPPMVGGIFYEHGHRMIASFVGFLTVILALWIWRKDARRWMKILGFVALAAVIIQGILGGLTVLFLLPTPVSVSHAGLAQSFFCVTALLALFTSRWWHETTPTLSHDAARPLAFMAAGLVLVVFVQLLLGAIVRHTGSGLAIPDVPLAYGQWLPSLSPDAMESYNRQQLQSDLRIAADGPLTATQVLVHFLHRTWALVVLAMTIVAFLRLRRSPGTLSRVRGLSALVLSLVVVQVGLGILTVATRKHEFVATAHVAVGAATLAVSVLMLFHILRHGPAYLIGLRRGTMAKEVLA